METKWTYKMTDYTLMELELIFEEVAKLPRTADTSYVVPDVLELVEQRIWDGF
jgi:hypothetical protein